MNAQFNPLRPFDTWQLPFTDWIDVFFDWISGARNFFRAVRQPVDWVLETVEGTLQFLPPDTDDRADRADRMAIGGTASGDRLFPEPVLSRSDRGLRTGHDDTLAGAHCRGILRCESAFRWHSSHRAAIASSRACAPVLDTMQTTPAFVYLVPIVVLFGIGNVFPA